MNKISIKSILTAIFLVSSLLVSSVEAGGWGKTEKTKEHEKSIWNEVYFDMNGFNLHAFVPNYTMTEMRNMQVSFFGGVDDNAYVLMTGFNEDFPNPKNQQEFVKTIEKSNPEHKVTPIDAKKLGMKFAVDLTPKTGKDNTYWRLICGKNRLVKMGTNDFNEARRAFFFDNLKVQ